MKGHGMNHYSFTQALRSTAWLLWADMQLFLRDWRNGFLNAIFWPTVLIFANGYIMPVMGLASDYGAFNTVGMLIIMASFTAWNSASVLAADLEGVRSIGYELTLPIPYWMVYVKIVLNYALRTSFFNLMSLIIGKLILGDGFDLSNLSIFSFILIYAVACIFFGTFALWAAVFAGSLERFGNIEIRVSGPLFFICGYSFPWAVLDRILPTMGKMMLFTPWIYAYEGVRASILGQAGYLNYWLCLGMLILFTVIFGFLGMRAFKKRLDCV